MGRLVYRAARVAWLADAEIDMTSEEAWKLCNIFENVDGHCEYCAHDACKEASEMGFGFRWFVEKEQNGSWHVSFEPSPA